MKPLSTLDQVNALLDAKGIPHQAASGQVDALTADPRLVEQLLKIKSDDVFAMSDGHGVWTVGAVRDIKVAPVTGQPAIVRATDILRAQRMREAVGRRFGVAMAQARKNITYNKAYTPAPTAASPQSAATKAQ